MRYDRQTATTWPHYGRFSPAERLFLSSNVVSLSLFSFPYPPILDFCVMPCLAHETFQTRQYVMFESSRVIPPSRPASHQVVLRGIEDSFSTLYISGNAPSKPRRDRSSDPVNIRYFTTSDAVTDMIMRQKYLERSDTRQRI